MERLYKGVIVGFRGSWNSGLATLIIQDDVEGLVSIHCDNGATGRALIGAFDCVAPGHRIDNNKIQGQEIYYSLDDTMPLDFLLAFTPVDEAPEVMVEYYENQGEHDEDALPGPEAEGNIEVRTTGNKRTFTHITDGRSWSEWKCAKCGEWLHEDEVVWVNPTDGKATVEHGKPYCVDHAPEEDEDAFPGIKYCEWGVGAERTKPGVVGYIYDGQIYCTSCARDGIPIRTGRGRVCENCLEPLARYKGGRGDE